MLDIRVIYHHFPHYRAPVIKELSKSSTNKYRFFGGTQSYAGIKPFLGDADVEIEKISFITNERNGSMKIKNYRGIFNGKPDAIIVIGNPNIFATWLIAAEARLRGIKVAFWAHGWLRPETGIKSFLRKFYFNIANVVLVYGKRSKKIGIASGFSEKKIVEIYNSLDWESQNNLYNKYEYIPQEILRLQIGLPASVPILACISRITEICHYDWLVMAVALLKNRHPKCIILMIGDGPIRSSLETLAQQQQVDLRCLGEIYDEETIARYLMAVDAVVSPGKVGLTAMHSLAYGTPVVTHGDFDRQMPEVEAINPGQTGEFFPYGDIEGLRDALDRIISDTKSLEERRRTCRQIIKDFYTPEVQVNFIETAMTEICRV